MSERERWATSLRRVDGTLSAKTLLSKEDALTPAIDSALGGVESSSPRGGTTGQLTSVGCELINTPKRNFSRAFALEGGSGIEPTPCQGELV